MFFHKELTKEKWESVSFFAQMSNIGAEIGRTINWRNKDKKISESAFYRGLELLDLTIADRKNRNKLKELCRLKEILADYFCFNNVYKSNDMQLNNYFYVFNYANAVNR